MSGETPQAEAVHNRERAEKAEAELAALQAAVQGLADEVGEWPHADSDGWPIQAYEVHEDVQTALCAALTDTHALQERLAQAKREALTEAADALEGRLGTEGAPKTLWEFRQWLRDRARAEAGETP